MSIESEFRNNVTVAVRVKTLDKIGYEPDKVCVGPYNDQPNNSIICHGDRGPNIFNFDHIFWSLGGQAIDAPEATQQTVFEDVGQPIVTSTLTGFNCSIFAYGQTGSGKSHTMMGMPSDETHRGLIPRIAEALFMQTSGETETGTIESTVTGRFEVKHQFVVSYVEIYMEKVQDLLCENLDAPSTTLKVREHPAHGPYVDGCTIVRVTSFEQVAKLIELGNSRRMVAATAMNNTSSRSHAVFTIQYCKTKTDQETQAKMDQASKLNLVDLAGSENAGSAGTTGDRLKEGGSINKSLLTLGMVIKALAEKGEARRRSKTDKQMVPYRDSVLTFLLKDSLGGNSRTTMLATIRPGLTYIEETLSTLRYADRAKSIVNVAKVNEDPLNKKIRQLQEEIERLMRELTFSQEREADKSLQIQAINERLNLALATASPRRGSLSSSKLGEGLGESSSSVTTLSPSSTHYPAHLRATSAAGDGTIGSPRTPHTLHVLSPRGVIQGLERSIARYGSQVVDAEDVAAIQAMPEQDQRQATAAYEANRKSDAPEQTKGQQNSLLTTVEHMQPEEKEDEVKDGEFLWQAEEGRHDRQSEVLRLDQPASAQENRDELRQQEDGAQEKDGQASPIDRTTPDGMKHDRGQDAAAQLMDTEAHWKDAQPMDDYRPAWKGEKGVTAAGESQAGSSTTLAMEEPQMVAGSEVRSGDVILLEGFLHKRGFASKTYKRRWCVVKGNRLFWYLKFKEEDSIHGAIPLSGCQVREAEEEVQEGRPYVFVIVNEKLPPDLSQLFLQASSEDERQRWIEAISKATTIKEEPGGKELQISRILKSECVLA